MRILVDVALATAFSRDRRHLWRQISVISASFLATFASCFALALPWASQEAYRVGSVRGPIYAGEPEAGSSTPPDGAVAILLYRATSVDGVQVPTVWIEPLPGHENDPAAVPRGLSELPEPGAAVLSPALVDDGYTAGDFGWLASSSGAGTGGTIGDPGIMATSEPLIFVRPAEGRTIANSGLPLYIKGFGVAPSEEFVAFAGDPEFLSPFALKLGVLACVLLPAAVLIVSGARARSRLREDRMRFLVTIGIASWRARTLIALETGALAAAGSASAFGLWIVVSRILTTIPVADVSVRPGGLVSPWWYGALVVVSVIACASIVGALGRIDALGRRANRRYLALGAVFGLAVSTILLLASAFRWLPVSESASSNLVSILVGVFGILLFTPLAMPQFISWVGRVLGHLASPTLWSTGRRMVAEPLHLSRIASVLSVLVILVSTIVSLALASVSGDPDDDGGRLLSRTTISWVDAQDQDVDRALQALSAAGDGVLVLRIVEPEGEVEGEGAAPPRVLVGDCAAALRFLEAEKGVTCDDGSGEALLEDALGVDVVTEKDNEGRVATNAVTVYSKATVRIEEMQEQLGWLPGLNVRRDSRGVFALLPVHRWLGAGIFSVLVLVGAAAIREIGDRSVDDAERDQQYSRIGLSESATRRLAWTTLLVPMATSVVLSALLSTIIAYAGQTIELMAQDPLRLVVVCISTTAATVVAVAMSFPARRAVGSVSGSGFR